MYLSIYLSVFSKYNIQVRLNHTYLLTCNNISVQTNFEKCLHTNVHYVMVNMYEANDS